MQRHAVASTLYKRCLNDILFTFRLWNEHPGTYPFFKDSLFKGKDLKDVDAKSGELASQAAAFHGLVDAWVKAIDDDATLTGLCNNFAEKHEKRQISKAQVKVCDWF